jgi:hypothetical protein
MDAPVPPIALVTARGAGAGLEPTVAALRAALPGVRVEVARPSGGPGGRGRDATLCARRLLDAVLVPAPPVVVLCPGDLGHGARELVSLVAAVRRDECDVALARPAGEAGPDPGRGPAAGLARLAIARLAGRRAPGRGVLPRAFALRGGALPALVPFAAGEALELGLAVDAARAGLRVAEVPVDLPPAARRALPAEARALADVGVAALRRG